MTFNASELGQFTGTDHWYRHGLMRHISYTDGVKYLAEKANCYWLIDKIATLQMLPQVKEQEFQVWKLRLAGNRGRLSCEDGNGGEVYFEDIHYTDFPLGEIDLWCENSVILLPSEH